MGKKRIKTIDLSQKEEKKFEKKGRAIVKSGKQHGRIADMGAVMLEEMEKRKEEEKKVIVEKPKEKKLKGKIIRPPKTRSKRYQTLRKLIKIDKFYPLPEAIELLKKTSNSQFDETIELHLVTFETGALTKKVRTEKKFPLVHLKIGKTSWSKKKLLENIQALIKAIDPNKIKKAVLASTMSPGIKVDISSPDRL